MSKKSAAIYAEPEESEESAPRAPKPKPAVSGLGKYDSDAYRREQALCNEALDSGEFDEMSDAEWIALCERVAQERAAAKASKAS